MLDDDSLDYILGIARKINNKKDRFYNMKLLKRYHFNNKAVSFFAILP